MLDSEQAFAGFETKAGIAFKNKALLKTAFTHRSYLNETRTGGEHNERLEFLGDAVLELVATDFLFRTYSAPEGMLTAYRAALVNTVSISGVAEALGMNECLLLSKGEAKDTGRARQSILANTFEAVIGALYLDQGYSAAAAFIERHLLLKAAEVVESGSWKDPKSKFQEIAQAEYGMTPRYETVGAEGPDHAKRFVVELYVGEKKVATGEGQSKQEAETRAAEHALEKSA
jgi:ribonuclease-3